MDQYLVRTLEMHSGPVNSVAISPDGKQVCSGSNDNTVLLWDIETGTTVDMNDEHSAPVTSVAFSRDGTSIYSASKDKNILKLDRTNNYIISCAISSFPITAMSISPNEDKICYVNIFGNLNLFNRQTGKTVNDDFIDEEDTENIFNYHFSQVAFSPDGVHVCGGVHNGGRMWNVETGETVRTFINPRFVHVRCPVFSLDGKYICLGFGDDFQTDNTVRLYNVETGEIVQEFFGHTQIVNSVAFSHDNKYICSGSDDNTVRLWKTTTGKLVHTFVGHTRRVSSVTFSPDGKYICSGSGDHSIKIWKTPEEKYWSYENRDEAESDLLTIQKTVMLLNGQMQPQLPVEMSMAIFNFLKI